MNTPNKLGGLIKFRFYITQHIRDAKLLINIANFLKCGKYSIRSNRPEIGDFLVTKFNDIKNIIIPFFIKYPFQGTKFKNFLNLKQVINLMPNNNKSLSKESFEKIKEIILLKKNRKLVIKSPKSTIKLGKEIKRYYSTANINNKSYLTFQSPPCNKYTKRPLALEGVKNNVINIQFKE
jgi:hypothetical protein